MKTAIVTGATGFIGKAMVNRLLADNVYVYAVCRNPERLNDLACFTNLKIVEASFDTYSVLRKIVCQPVDSWFHLAFQGGFSGEALKNYALQLGNTQRLCESVELASRMEVHRFIFASTVNEIEALGHLVNGVVSPRNTCIYSAAKLAGEIMGKTIAFNNGMEFLSALIAMPYGEHNLARTLPNIVMEQINEQIPPKLIEGNNYYDLVYIDDIVQALSCIAEKGRNLQSYYVGHHTLRTFREIITELRDILNPNVSLRFGEYPDAPTLNYQLIDLNALYQDTGFECTADFRESILKTANWLKTVEEKK